MEMQRNAGRGLLSVINDILDFSKIEAGQLDLEAAPFSLKEIAEDCIKLVSDEAQRKGLKPMVAVGGDVHDRVVGDSIRLRQVLLNLVSNGVKFTHSGYVALTIERVPGAMPRAALRRRRYRDRHQAGKPGRAVSALRASRQFDDAAVWRLGSGPCDLQATGRIDGRRHRGVERVWPGLDVLLHDRAAARRGSCTGIQDSAPRQHRGCYRLLLAEDNELNRQLIKAMLEQAGHKVVVVNDGAEAVRIAIRQRVRRDPDGRAHARNGWLCRHAGDPERDAPLPSLPIIALTANALPDEVERCLDAGMNAHVPKPVNWPALFAMIDRLVLECRESGGRGSGPNGPSAGQAGRSATGLIFSIEATLADLRTSIGDDNTANLLKLFVVEAQQRFLSQPASAEARRSMAEEAHTFGGSAAMLGFEALADACRALDAAALQDRPLDEFLERARRARDAALMKIEELIVGGEFTQPVRTTA